MKMDLSHIERITITARRPGSSVMRIECTWAQHEQQQVSSGEHESKYYAGNSTWTEIVFTIAINAKGIRRWCVRSSLVGGRLSNARRKVGEQRQYRIWGTKSPPLPRDSQQWIGTVSPGVVELGCVSCLSGQPEYSHVGSRTGAGREKSTRRERGDADRARGIPPLFAQCRRH